MTEARKSKQKEKEELATARRNQILQAAIKVFAEKGYARTTIKDIAREADIADGTIYIYFKDKEALLTDVLDLLNESEHREEHFAQMLSMDFRDFLRLYVRQRFDYLSDEGMEVLRIGLAESLINPKLRELYMQQVVKPTTEIAEKYLLEVATHHHLTLPNPTLHMRLVTAMFLGLFALRMLDDNLLKDDEIWQKIPDEMADLILGGLKFTPND